jgi:hypothetical protein
MRKDQIDSAVSTGRGAMQKQYNTAQTKVCGGAQHSSAAQLYHSVGVLSLLCLCRRRGTETRRGRGGGEQ